MAFGIIFRKWKMAQNLLRGIGPRTFISYCFQDKDLATRLRDFLSASGFQVKMEDETSLLNMRLPDVLPQRIEDAECFIQVRTAAANKSYWVKQELVFAERRRARDAAFTLIPVVLDATTLDDDARQWVYVDAAAGLTDHALATVRDAGLASVRLVRVDPTAPTSLVAADVDRLLAQHESKRVIFDSDGYWFNIIDAVISHAKAKPPTADVIGFYKQEERRRERLVWLFARADVAKRVLTRELNQRVQESIIERDDAKRAVNAFYRILFEHYLWHVAQNALATKKITLDDDEVDGLRRFGQPETHESEEHGMQWAMAPTTKARFSGGLQPTDYDFRRMVKTGLDSPTKGGAYVFFPRGAIGPDWMQLLQVAPQPESIISRWDWSVYGLPQIAARAVGGTGRYNPDASAKVFEAIDKGMGWAIEDYEHIGLP
jgi:TIR domain